MSRFSIVVAAEISRPLRCNSVMNSLRFRRNTASNGGISWASMRPIISSVVKCAESRMTPRPESSAFLTCSTPVNVVIDSRCRRLAQRPRPISMTAIPRALKCSLARSSRCSGVSSGKQSSILRRATARRDPPIRWASRPSRRPVARAMRCGNRQTTRSRPIPIQTGQVSGAR